MMMRGALAEVVEPTELYTVAARKKPDNCAKVRVYCMGGSVGAARGGSTQDAAERARSAGRGDDEMLVHMTPDEFKTIKQLWGEPTINPDTGLPEYGFFSKAWKKIKKGVKKVVGSKAFQTLAPIALAAIPGVGPVAAGALSAGLGAAGAAARDEPILGGAIQGALSSATRGVGSKILGGLGPGAQLVQGERGVGPLARIAGGLSGVFGGGGPEGLLPTSEEGAPIQFYGSATDPTQTAPPWLQALRKWGPIAGAGALALASSRSGGDGGGKRPELPESFGESLPVLTMNRQFVGLPSAEDYFTYGLPGAAYSGQHLFINPAEPFPTTPAEATGGRVSVDSGLGPMTRLRDDDIRSMLYGGRSYQHGGYVDEILARSREMMPKAPELPPPERGLPPGGQVQGPGTGRSDDIEALLSDGEYVMDAETVSLLGDGSNEAGARRLDELRRNVRRHKGKNLSKGRFSYKAKEPDKYMRGAI